MNRLLAWISGAAGGIAVYRWLTRERATPLPELGHDPRADELRAKLQESKPLVEEQAVVEAAETPVDEAPDPAERRRQVHDQGRAAVNRMRRSGSD